MSYVVIHADQMLTVLADDPVVPAADVERVRDALALFKAGEQARGAVRAAAEEATRLAHETGYQAGLAEGRAAAAEALAAEIAELARRERSRQRDVGRLALEVVRRIVGEIGEAEAAARIAERAVTMAHPEGAARVRVHPAALGATQLRLAQLRGLSVQSDAELGPTDCVVETAVGRVHAGLETQLARIAAAWADGRAGD